MPNLRLVHDNKADSATIVASTTAGTLTTDNLKTDIKSEIWRATATSGTLTFTWAASVLIGCVVLPFCNFTSTATIRVRGYTDASDTSPIFDTGVVLACAYAPLGLWGWANVPLGVNAFSYGGGAYARVWFDHTSVRKLVVDLVDVDNTNSYIEVSRAIVGPYWSPKINADLGATFTPTDTSTNYRTNAGNLETTKGTRSRKINFNLSYMYPLDRAAFYRIVWSIGMSKAVFLSLFPDQNDDPELEQMFAMYGKLTSLNAIGVPQVNAYSTSMQIEEI